MLLGMQQYQKTYNIYLAGNTWTQACRSLGYLGKKEITKGTRHELGTDNFYYQEQSRIFGDTLM